MKRVQYSTILPRLLVKELKIFAALNERRIGETFEDMLVLGLPVVLDNYLKTHEIDDDARNYLMTIRDKCLAQRAEIMKKYPCEF